ncbi:MAG: NAD-dependent epimerase/dehydratase family protein [Parvibaculum sp.]|uniref:NAD-dependent epimerase/dehydratase family protein n=1 Tax=Parvibaculum sp. TaxID=2024848 RepID=UPI0034A00A53
MKIFITGASGFVGGAAARELARDNEVLALSRSEKSDAIIKALGATPVRGDLKNIDAPMLNGVDAVVHCAAKVETWGPMREFIDINVKGTERLLKAARKAGVKRFVHIGTEAALFYGQAMNDLDETAPMAFTSPLPYPRSKALAERAVRAANADGFTAIVLRPRFIWGPGDQTLLPALKTMVAAGRFTWIDRGRALTDTVHVDNVVHAIRLALTKGTGGEAYFITDGGEPISFRDMMTKMAATIGLELPDKSMPGWLARGAARFLDLVWRLTLRRTPPPIDPHTAALLSRNCTLKIGKARRELGYEPVISRDAGIAALMQGKG